MNDVEEGARPPERRGVRDLVRENLQQFSSAEGRVAKVVLADPFKILSSSVSEVANEAETSTASVVRMCTSIGLKGFQDLKTRIAVELAATGSLGPSAAVGAEGTLVEEILKDFASALSEVALSIDEDAVEQVATMLAVAPKAQIAAVGTSAMLAFDFAYRLCTLGVQAIYISDVHAQHVQARMLGPDDVLLAVSHTGSTFETLSAARAAKQAGAKVLSVTSYARSPLTEISDLSVIAGSSETRYRVEAATSRLVHVAILDALCVLVRQKNPHSAAAETAAADVIAEHRF